MKIDKLLLIITTIVITYSIFSLYIVVGSWYYDDYRPAQAIKFCEENPLVDNCRQKTGLVIFDDKLNITKSCIYDPLVNKTCSTEDEWFYETTENGWVNGSYYFRTHGGKNGKQ